MVSRSIYRDQKRWLTEGIGAHLPSPATTPMCYGGDFVANTANILKNAHVWPNLTQSLSRETLIEEAHDAERSWAGLLMTISKADLKAVRCAALTIRNEWPFIFGFLRNCNAAKNNSCAG